LRPIPISRVRRGAAFTRTVQRGERSIRRDHQHANDVRRAGVCIGGAGGDTAALAIIPEFIGLALGAASHRRWKDQGEKSKSSEKARKERHCEKNGVQKRATRVEQRQKSVFWMHTWGNPLTL
jgi:hypothetical protein